MTIVNAAPYLVQRQDADGGEWRPLACCSTLEYAQMIALMGLRHHHGTGYRARDIRTGSEIGLAGDSEVRAA